MVFGSATEQVVNPDSREQGEDGLLADLRQADKGNFHRGKSEMRNPKCKTRRKPELPNDSNRRFGHFLIRACLGLRYSNFGFKL
jgi:hypothetical protein